MITTASTTDTELAPFPFPKIYNYPPFFTRQVNDRTWHAQLLNWAELILAYCRYYRLFTLDLKIPTGTSSDNSSKNERRGELLFRNDKIGRTLKEEMLREIFEYMVSNGLAMWIDGEIDKKLLDDDTSLNKTGGDSDEDDEDNAYERAYARYEQQHHKQQKSSGKSNSAAAKSGIIVYWRRPQEWATLITDWVDETGQNGSVFTLYELVSGDAVQRQEFRGLHPAVLLQVVDVLVRRGRASVMKDSSTGLVAGLKML